MFTNHFKMTRRPFIERPSVEQMMRDDRVSQGLARLEFLLQQETIGLITGATGVGKSSLIKLFLHSLCRNRYRPYYLHLTHISPTCFLKLIVQNFDEIPLLEKSRLFLQILEKCRQSELSILLIVDEAHFLTPESLSHLRLLVSSALDETPPLKILLVGQESLKDTLLQSSHAPLLQRITVRYHLSTLNKEQTASYIDFQMSKTGAPLADKIFETEVKSFIHDHANGIPRQINNLATACLIQAVSRKTHRIDQDLFFQTTSELLLP